MEKLKFVVTILAGYSTLSFAAIKVLWLIKGVHFHDHSVAHSPQAPFLVDLAFIAALTICGLLLVLVRYSAHSSIVALSLILTEAVLFHDGPHSLSESVIFAVSLGYLCLSALFSVTLCNNRQNEGDLWHRQKEQEQ